MQCVMLCTHWYHFLQVPPSVSLSHVYRFPELLNKKVMSVTLWSLYNHLSSDPLYPPAGPQTRIRDSRLVGSWQDYNM